MKQYHWDEYKQIPYIHIEKNDRPVVDFYIAFNIDHIQTSFKSGLHLMAQMLLKGTKSFNKDAFEERIDSMGACLSISVGNHSIAIEGEVLSRNYTQLLDLCLSALSEPLFQEDEFKKLVDETRSKIKQSSESDVSLAKKGFLQMVYDQHPYADNARGDLASLEKVSLDDIKSLYREFTNCLNITFGFAGSLQNDQIQTTLERFHQTLNVQSFWNIPERQVEHHYQHQKKLLFIDKPNRSQSHFFIGHPTFNYQHPDYYALKTFMMAFAGGIFQAQYMQEIRVKRGWAYGAYGSLSLHRDLGSFFLYTYPEEKDSVDAIKLSLELLDKAVNHNSLKDDDIHFSKSYMIKSFPFKVDTPQKIMSEMLYNKMLNLDEQRLFQYREKIKVLTVDQIREAARKHIHMDQLCISMLGSAENLKPNLLKTFTNWQIEQKDYLSIL